MPFPTKHPEFQVTENGVYRPIGPLLSSKHWVLLPLLLFLGKCTTLALNTWFQCFNFSSQELIWLVVLLIEHDKYHILPHVQNDPSKTVWIMLIFRFYCMLTSYVALHYSIFRGNIAIHHDWRLVEHCRLRDKPSRFCDHVVFDRSIGYNAIFFSPRC